MQIAPDHAVVSADAKAAFGSVYRSALWKAALDACPKLAGVLQTLFGVQYTALWAEKEVGGYEKLRVARRKYALLLHDGWSARSSPGCMGKSLACLPSLLDVR